MAIDFDRPIDRTGTQCEKWDGRGQAFGRDDVIPLWVADMDFATPDAVQQALADRAAHPVYGYSFPGDDLMAAFYRWYRQRHDWHIDPAQLLLTPGVVPSLFAAINALTQKGDRILVPTPVYPPFFAAVKKNHRQLVQCPLLETTQGYELDFERLEKEAKAGASMLLLCSPHNPVGRVWTQAELEALISISLRYKLILVSDEIHCDLVHSAAKHTVLARLAPPELRLLTAVSPSKTFNIPGLNMSALVVSQATDRQLMTAYLSRLHVSPFNPFTLTAFQAAYEAGADWLDELLPYLHSNSQFVLQQLERIAGVDCIPPQATCLMWLDARQLGLDDATLRDRFVQTAGLGLNPGIRFGQGGTGFMRLNIGTRRALLETAMQQLQDAFPARG